MLTRAAERDLAIRAKAGDRAAMGELLAAHDGFLRMMALRSKLEPIEDAVQEARIVAIKSIPRYDPDRGVRFTSFLGRHVVRCLSRVRQESGVIRLPSAENVKKAKGGPDNARRARRVASTACPVGDNGAVLGDFIRDRTDRADVIAEADRAEQAERLRRHIARLPYAQREVVRRRMLGLTQMEIADAMGVSRQAIFMAEERAHKNIMEMYKADVRALRRLRH